MIKIDKIIWDEWNIKHIARHDVIPSEVEELLHEDYENVYYVITAREADKKEQNEK